MQQYLKNTKTTKIMQKRLILFLSVFYIIHFLIPSVSAVYSYQTIYPNLEDNHTMTNYMYVVNPYEEMIVPDSLDVYDFNPSIILNPLDLNQQILSFTEFYETNESDFLYMYTGVRKTGVPYQFGIKYNIYVKTQNEVANYNLIEYCTLNISTQKYIPLLQGGNIEPIVQQKFETFIDRDVLNQEYYFILDRGDTAYVKIDCYYTNSSARSNKVPNDMYLVAPTYDCNLCEQYKWAKIQPLLQKTDFLQTSMNNNLLYIKKLVNINYEFVVIIYWTILIMLVVFSVGLIFLGVYYAYLYISKLTR